MCAAWSSFILKTKSYEWKRELFNKRENQAVSLITGQPAIYKCKNKTKWNVVIAHDCTYLQHFLFMEIFGDVRHIYSFTATHASSQFSYSCDTFN